MRKIYLILCLMGGLILMCHAQNCSDIKDRIEYAISENRLDYALTQIKAFRACDVSIQGKQAADTWTELIFQRIQELEKKIYALQNDLRKIAKDAQREKEILQRELELLQKETAAVELARKQLEEENRLTKNALSEKYKVQELNLFLDSINEMHLLAQQMIIRKKYVDAFRLLEDAYNKITLNNSHDESLEIKKTAIKYDLDRVNLFIKLQSELNTYLENGDSLLALGAKNYFNALKWYKKAGDLNFDSLAVLKKYSILESLLTKKVFRQLKSSLYDSLLFSSIEINTSLNMNKKLEQKLRWYMWYFHVDDFPTNNINANSYMHDYQKKFRHKLEFGVGLKSFYLNPFFDSKIIVKYKENSYSFKTHYWYIPYFYNISYYLKNRDVVTISIASRKNQKPFIEESKGELEDNVITEVSEQETDPTISFLFEHEFFGTNHKKASSISAKWLVGLSIGYFENLDAFYVQFGNQRTNAFTYVNLPETVLSKIGNSQKSNSHPLYSRERFFHNQYQDIFSYGYDFRTLPSGGYTNIIAGMKIEQKFKRTPLRSFMIIDYNYSLDRKSKRVVFSPADLKYNILLSTYGEIIPEENKQEIYDYFKACDCEISFESNPRRLSTGFTFSLGLSYRF